MTSRALVASLLLLGLVSVAALPAASAEQAGQSEGAPTPTVADSSGAGAVPDAVPDAAAEAAAVVAADDPDPWPRVFEGEKATVRVYPPQVDSWDGSRIAAHSALEVLEKGKESPLYGVIAFEARTRVDKEARLVVIDEFLGVRARFPTHRDLEPRLLGFLQQKLNDKVRVISLDRLEAALAANGPSQRAAASAKVENRPPKLLFADKPTMLVMVDGAPVWRKVEGGDFERLLNTRPLILRSANGFYLHLFDGWLGAPNLAGPWKVSGQPYGLADAARSAMKAQPADLLDGGGDQELDEEGNPVAKPTLARGPVPEIVVATEPTELVVFDGAAKWAAIPGTSLEFVENSGGNVFRKADGSAQYVLVSGRWFEAKTLDGPWTFVPQMKLLADFRKIPDDSPKENVKASVAGTAQADEAVIANSIPETSEVQRKGAKFTPAIDGEPSWKPIEGTSLAYVVNSPTPIVRVAKDSHYALDKGVWFVAPSLGGPWNVAVKVPNAIYTIPTSSPLHYVTYVRVYASTPDVVVVGYTPGYYGTVVSENVVVYGTGYTYSPWVGTSWYGYPYSYGYGCGMTYTPWNGWAFSIGVGWAWGYWGGWYAPYYPPYWGGYYGWYGGAMYGPGGGGAVWGPGGWAGTTGNIYRQWGNVSTVSRYSGGYNAWTGNAWRAQSGMAYNSRTGGIAAGQRGAVANVYTGGYAYGGRGVAQTGNGNVVGGSRVTMGNAGSGSQITAGRVGGYNPATGQSGSAAWARGDNGGVARVGDDYYAGKDGNVYKRNGSGDWSQVDRSGQWNSVHDSSRTRDLNRQYSGRSSGSTRYSGGRMGGMSRGGGGRRR